LGDPYKKNVVVYRAAGKPDDEVRHINFYEVFKGTDTHTREAMLHIGANVAGRTYTLTLL